MDRSLWLLLWLRARAWLRHYARGLRTVKGALLSVVAALVFLPMIGLSLFAPSVNVEGQGQQIRHYGALGLFAYALLNFALASGERAVTFAPPEVDFLFPGPYRPRQVLYYKIAGGALGTLFSAFVVTLVFARHAAHPVPAFLGVLLALQLLYLLQLAAGLAVATAGALAYGRARRLTLAALAVAAAAALAPTGRAALNAPPREALERAARSPLLKALVSPFEPAVLTFTAPRVDSGLLAPVALGLLVNAALFLAVVALNGRFLEASAGAGAQAHARLRGEGRAQGAVPPALLRLQVPMPPWWGGVGPVAWRQAVTASRSLPKLGGLATLFFVPVLLARLMGAPEDANTWAVVNTLSIGLFAPSLIAFDFRSDLGHMDALKALPTGANRLVLGQLLTPCLLLCAGEWAGLAALAWAAGGTGPAAAVAALMVLPFNLVLVAVENLYFLWFPFRMAPGNATDAQALGRQMLLLFAKMVTVGAIAGIAAGAGGLLYYLTGALWPSAFVAWSLMLAQGLALVPLLGQAFRAFDVAAVAAD